MTPTQVKKRLAEKYPAVNFETADGRSKTCHVVWTGGPSAADVRFAMGWCDDNYRHWTVCRHNTPEEQAIEDARRNADPNARGSAAWIADTPSREAREAAQKAANRKAGAAKAAETRAAKSQAKTLVDPVFAGHPYEVSFSQYSDRPEITWTDGPSEKSVQKALGENYRLNPLESWDRREARQLAEIARADRLAARKAERDAIRFAHLADIKAGRKILFRRAPHWTRRLQPFLPLTLPWTVDRLAGPVLKYGPKYQSR